MTASEGSGQTKALPEVRAPSWSDARAGQFQDILGAIHAVSCHVQKVASLPSGDSPERIVTSIPKRLVWELGADGGWAMTRSRDGAMYSLLSPSVSHVAEPEIRPRDSVSTPELESIGSPPKEPTRLVAPDEAPKLLSGQQPAACQAVVHHGEFAGTGFALVFVARQSEDSRPPFDSVHRRAVACVGAMMEGTSRVAEAALAYGELMVARSGISRTAIAKACRRLLQLWYESLPAGDDRPPALPDELDEMCADLLDRWRETLALPGLRRRQAGVPLAERADALRRAMKFHPPADPPGVLFRIDSGPEATPEADTSEPGSWVVIPRECTRSTAATSRVLLWMEAALAYTGGSGADDVAEWIEQGRKLLYPSGADAAAVSSAASEE